MSVPTRPIPRFLRVMPQLCTNWPLSGGFDRLETCRMIALWCVIRYSCLKLAGIFRHLH
jgi:hypothetical protein